MATDRTEPRTTRIIGFGVASLLSLAAIHFTLRSYFFSMYEDEQHEKIALEPTLLRDRVRNEQNAKLGAGKPIDTAINEMAVGRPAAISLAPDGVPLDKLNLDPMSGWTTEPHEFKGFTTAEMNGAGILPTDLPVAGADAGIVMPTTEALVEAGVVIDTDAGAAVLGVLMVAGDAEALATGDAGANTADGAAAVTTTTTTTTAPTPSGAAATTTTTTTTTTPAAPGNQ